MAADSILSITDDFFRLGSQPFPIFLYCAGNGDAVLLEGSVTVSGVMCIEQLQSLGIEPSAVSRLLITHSHGDHVFGAVPLRDAYPELEIMGSARAQEKMADLELMSMFRDVDDQSTELLKQAGIVESRHVYARDESPLVPVDTVIAEGDRVELGPDDFFDVYFSPGHSDCSLSFYHPAKKLLVISDAAGMPVTACNRWWNLYFDGYAQVLETVDRLSRFDADVLCPGHMSVIQGRDAVQAFWDDARQALAKCHQHIIDSFRTGRTRREIAEAMGLGVYEGYPYTPLKFIQKNCSILTRRSLEYEGIEY